MWRDGDCLDRNLRLGMQDRPQLPLPQQVRKRVSRLESLLPGLLAAHLISFPMATAVSHMRFENPHSLSYQVRIRTMLPSMTLVWSM